MAIPVHRIATCKSLEKAKMRNRRKNAKTKDWHRKHNLFHHPEYYMRKKAWHEYFYDREDDLPSKHHKLERKLTKYSRIDYV